MAEELKKITEDELKEVAGGVNGKVGLDEGPWMEVANLKTGWLALRSDPSYNYNNEIGKVAGVRFVETTEAKVFTGAGASGRDVYSTLIIARDAYGTTEISGGGLQHIVKQLGSAGTADPLNQRATVGWKATKVAERLVEQYMIRIETASNFTA
jgi:N4-gp56 family major capsid protein